MEAFRREVSRPHSRGSPLIQKLVDQMKAVTQATKEIEAQISDNVWARQRRWDITKETLFDVVRKMAVMQRELFNLNLIFLKVKTEHIKQDDYVPLTEGARKTWLNALYEFQDATLLAELVCGEPLRQTLRESKPLVQEFALAVVHGEALSLESTVFTNLSKLVKSLSDAIRKELRIE